MNTQFPKANQIRISEDEDQISIECLPEATEKMSVRSSRMAVEVSQRILMSSYQREFSA